MMSGCGSQKKGASAQTRRKECCRWRIKERDCASKIVALTPPPWRQRIRGNDLVSGFTGGILEGGGEEGIFRNRKVSILGMGDD